MRLLIKHNPTGGAPSTEVLESVFTELEQRRIPRTSELVKRAREEGDSIRVVSGVEAGKKRNDIVRRMFADFSSGDESSKAGRLYQDMLEQPFANGKSDI